MIEAIWTVIKCAWCHVIGVNPPPPVATPIKKADEMLSTAIFDLTEALKESKRDRRHDD